MRVTVIIIASLAALALVSCAKRGAVHSAQDEAAAASAPAAQDTAAAVNPAAPDAAAADSTAAGTNAARKKAK